MKSLFLRLVHYIFKLRIMENLLVSLMQKSTDRSLLIKLAPPNTYYNQHDLRYCDRYGITYKLHLYDYQSWLLYYFSENDSSFGALKYLKTGDSAIDVGGNIGQTALMMAKKVGQNGRVYSFEPFKRTFSAFKDNLLLNPKLTNVILENLALGEKSERLNMYVENIMNSGGNRIKPPGKVVSSEVEEVSIITLDEYIINNRLNEINLIKIDVEGFELKVLKGAQMVLKKHKPDLYIEANDTNLKAQGDSLKLMSDFLKTNGYTIFNASNDMELNGDWENIFKGTDIYCKII